MHIISELVVVGGNERQYSLIHRVHLNERHLSILLEELEAAACPVSAKQLPQVLLAHIRWYVGQVKGLRGRENIVKILATGLFESMQRRVGKVLSEARVGLPILRHLHRRMLRGKHADLLGPKLAPIQVGKCRARLLATREINQRRVLFIKKNLHAQHVPVNTEQREQRLGCTQLFIQI